MHARVQERVTACRPARAGIAAAAAAAAVRLCQSCYCDDLLQARNNTREVVAVFSQDEARLEVVVTLPASFPLRVPASNGTKGKGFIVSLVVYQAVGLCDLRAVGGIPEKTWRRYMLNMHSVSASVLTADDGCWQCPGIAAADDFESIHHDHHASSS